MLLDLAELLLERFKDPLLVSYLFHQGLPLVLVIFDRLVLALRCLGL